MSWCYKKLSYFFLYLLLISHVAIAQTGFDTVYNYCTGGVGTNFWGSYADTDRFFLFAATSTKGVSSLHGALAAYDYQNHPVWNKKLILNPLEINSTSANNNAIIKTGVGRYLLLGTIAYYNNQQKKILEPYFYAFNKNGDSIWFKRYYDTAKTRVLQSAFLHEGEIIAAGSVSSDDGYHYNLWVSKYDSIGNFKYQKELMTMSIAAKWIPYVNKITLSADKQHYLISGHLIDTTTYIFGSCFIKTDTAFNIKWIKTLSKAYIRQNGDYTDVVTDPSGGYYFVSTIGKPDKLGHVLGSVYFGKLNEHGDTIWTNRVCDNLEDATGYEIDWSSDRKYLLIRASTLDESPALIKADTLGNVLWYYMPLRYTNSNPALLPDQRMNTLSVTPDEHYLMAGYAMTDSGQVGWVIMTDSSGRRFTGDSTFQHYPDTTGEVNILPLKHGNYSVCPNPAYDELLIGGIKTKTTIAVHDIMGRTVYSNTTSKSKETIPVKNWPQGTYIIQLENEEGRVVKKIQKE